MQDIKQTDSVVATNCKLAEASDSVGGTDCKVAEASDSVGATDCKLTKSSENVGAIDCKLAEASDNIGDVNCKLSFVGTGFARPIRTLSKCVAIGKGTLGHGRKVKIITLRINEKALRTAENRISANLSVSSSVLSVTNTYFMDHKSSDNVGDINCKLLFVGAGVSCPYGTLYEYDPA